MGEPPSKNDPSPNWPEDIKQAYDHLKLPSLYDAVLASEKISYEIRKQERSLKTMNEALHALVAQMTTLIDVVQEEWEEYEDEDDEESIDDEKPSKKIQSRHLAFENQVEGDLTNLEIELLDDKQTYLEDQSQSLIMESHDVLVDLSRTIKQLTRQLVHLIPKKIGFISYQPAWLKAVSEIHEQIFNETERSRYRLLTRLEDMAIEPIEPKPGDLFDPSAHHAIDQVEGGEFGTISELIRLGYRQQTQVLRLAEVVVYH